jgi:hypothetical protein
VNGLESRDVAIELQIDGPVVAGAARVPGAIGAAQIVLSGQGRFQLPARGQRHRAGELELIITQPKPDPQAGRQQVIVLVVPLAVAGTELADAGQDADAELAVELIEVGEGQLAGKLGISGVA